MNKQPASTCTFPGQDDNEIVQVVIYKHIFSVLPVLIVSVGLLIAGVMLMVYSAVGGEIRLPSDLGALGKTSTVGIPFMPLSFILLIIGFLLGFAAIYVWRQNKMLITNENVVDMDQHGIFSRVISTLRLSRVQDVSVAVKGPMQTTFNYGTINIETAGEKDLFEFDYVPNPYEVKAQVQDLFERFVEHRPQEGDGVRTAAKSAPKAEVDANDEE